MTELCPPIARQHEIFADLQRSIDEELRGLGFAAVLAAWDMESSGGLIVVGRSFEYSSAAADIHPDLDPFAVPLVTCHDVGLQQGDPGGACWWSMRTVCQRVMGEEELTEDGHALTSEQRAAVDGALRELAMAKQTLLLPALTKSRLRISYAGD
ncbi:MAG TPA: hypothetical protein VLF69_01645 [Candidatus Saccharimonadales bacterium]|nr:hypothetical protein [Candidatus Saccharimonadales bacterium]